MQKDGQRAHIHCERSEPEQVRGNPGQLGADDPDELASRGNLLVDIQQFLDCQHVCDVVGQGRQVIQSVGVRDKLGVGHVLGDFFIASMQVTHIRHCLGDDLAIQFEDDPQNTVRRRV